VTAKDLATLTRLEAASEDLTADERASIAAVLASVQKIVAMCRRYNTSALAQKALAELEGK